MKLYACEAELKVLYQISRMVGQILDLDQALEDVLRVLSESLAMERATVTLVDRETGKLRIRASHGLGPKQMHKGIYRPDEGITGLIFNTAQPFVVSDISGEPLFLNKTQSGVIEKESLSFLGVPIVLHGETIGVLSVDRLFGAEISFEEDIRFLSVVATLFAQFIHLHRLVGEREKDMKRWNQSLLAEVSEKYNHFFLMGKSQAMLKLRQLVEKVAPSRASVLLQGESGTGKTLVGRILHELSHRLHGPFVKLNCAGLSESLLEPELFGYEKEARNGAVASKSGRFEEADGGTLFFENVGELSLSFQAKLLHFLEEKEFERLGNSRTRKVDVRVIAATSRNLSKAISDGRFREDLYYRLNMFPINVPPLRERKEDIALLAPYYLEKATREYGQKLSFAPHSLDILETYSWPGNVRELENLMERLALLVEGPRIEPEVLLNMLPSEADEGDLEQETSLCMAQIERKEMIAALKRNQWVQSWAARDLGFTLRQFNYRIKKYGLKPLICEEKKVCASAR